MMMMVEKILIGVSFTFDDEYDDFISFFIQ